MKSEVDKLMEELLDTADSIDNDDTAVGRHDYAKTIHRCAAVLCSKFAAASHAVVERVQPPGELLVGINDALACVSVQFQNPAWFVHFTADQARGFAHSLLKKADELEADRRAAGGN